MINTYTPCNLPLITACYHCTVHTHTCTYTYIYIYCLLSMHTHIRGRSYQFEEFLLTWGDRLRSGGKMTAITAGLQRDVDKYQVPYQSALSWRKLCPSPSHSTLPPPPSLHSPPSPLTPPGTAASAEVREGRGLVSGALARDVPHAGVSSRNHAGEALVWRHSHARGRHRQQCRQTERAVQVRVWNMEFQMIEGM